MKEIIKTIGAISTVGVIAFGSYLLGTSQAEMATEIKAVEKDIEVVPDGYIDTYSDEFQKNYVDMRKVVHWEANDGLQLYYADGTGYYMAGGID